MKQPTTKELIEVIQNLRAAIQAGDKLSPRIASEIDAAASIMVDRLKDSASHSKTHPVTK